VLIFFGFNIQTYPLRPFLFLFWVFFYQSRPI
jgi:hypothetical protein